MQLLLQVKAKEEGKEKGKSKDGGKGEKRTVCQAYLTDKGCPKGEQSPHAHPRKTGKCLRCGATGHDLASCRRPARDPKTKGSPPPLKGQGRGRGKAKAKPKPKAKAQAHESTAQTAGASAAWALEEEAGYGDACDELNFVTSASACSFYTPFLPTFHAASTQDASMEDHPENPAYLGHRSNTLSSTHHLVGGRRVRRQNGFTSRWPQEQQ